MYLAAIHSLQRILVRLKKRYRGPFVIISSLVVGSAAPLCPAATQDDFLKAFHTLVRLRNDPTAKLTEIESAKNDFLVQAAGKVSSTQLDVFINPHDQAQLDKCCKDFIRALPNGTDWYLRAWIDPVTTSSSRQDLSVVGGVIASSRPVKAKHTDGTFLYCEYVLKGEPFVELSSDKQPSEVVLAVPPNDIVILQNNLRSLTDTWRSQQEVIKSLSADDRVMQLSKLKIYRADLSDIQQTLLSESMVGDNTDSLESRILSGITPICVEKLRVLSDAEFMYCLRRANLTSEERQDAAQICATIAALRFGSDWKSALSTLMEYTESSGSDSPGHKMAPIAKVQVALFGAGLANVMYNGLEPYDYSAGDSFLRKDISREEVETVMKRLYPKMLAQLKVDLLETEGWPIKMSTADYSSELRIFDAAVHDFPEGSMAKLGKLSRLLLSNNEGERKAAEKAVRDISETATDGITRSMACMLLGLEALSLRDYASAKVELEQAYSLNPKEADILYALFFDYVQLKDPKAQDIRQQFLAIEPVGSRADYVKSLN